MLKKITILIVLMILSVGSSRAFDGNRKGFIIGGGIGLTPVAKIGGEFESQYDFYYYYPPDYEPEFDKVVYFESGFHFRIGYAVDNQNMIVLVNEGMGMFTDPNSGFYGIKFLRYKKPQAKSILYGLGAGLMYVPSYEPSPAVFWEWDFPDIGFGMSGSVGYEFYRHLEGYLSLSFGKVNEVNRINMTLTVNAIAF